MTKAKAETDRLPSGFPSDEPLNTGARLKLLLRNDQPKSLHIALRAEAALISGDVLAAAALTVTFLDVALLDAADIAFGSRFPAGFIDYVKREVAIPKGDPLRLRLKALAPPPAGLDWIRPPYDSEIEEWLRFSRLRFQKEWQESALFRVIGETGLPALAKSLEQLTRALHRPKTTAGRDSPADFRNRVIHSFPKESEIERAVEDYVRVALWTATPSTRAANRALRFLSPTTAPTQVLNELGVGNARLLYDSLVEALCSDIAACPLV